MHVHTFNSFTSLFIPGTPTHRKPLNAPHAERRVLPKLVPRYVANATPVNTCCIKSVLIAQQVRQVCMEKPNAPNAPKENLSQDLFVIRAVLDSMENQIWKQKIGPLKM